MKESTLWGHLKPELKRFGKFQKISDRFTPGVPDVLGVYQGVGIAMELKEFDGVRVLKVSFRPGQLDWLRDWGEAKGASLVVVSQLQTVWVFHWEEGEALEAGIPVNEVDELSLLKFTKTRSSSWNQFARDLVALDGRRAVAW